MHVIVDNSSVVCSRIYSQPLYHEYVKLFFKFLSKTRLNFHTSANGAFVETSTPATAPDALPLFSYISQRTGPILGPEPGLPHPGSPPAHVPLQSRPDPLYLAALCRCRRGSTVCTVCGVVTRARTGAVMIQCLRLPRGAQIEIV